MPCHQDRVLALLDPYRGERDIVPGWRCTGIAISDVIGITLTSADRRIDVVLHDPAWEGEAIHATENYRITVKAGPNVAPADAERVGSAVAGVIAANDRASLWYQTVYSPFPLERGPTCVSRRALLLVAALLLALAAVVIHWLLRRRSLLDAEALPAPTRREWAALSVLLLSAAAVYLVPTCLRFVRYGNTSADLGIYAHAFWNAWQGHGLFNSPEGLDHLSSHASPGLYLLLPLYALAPSPLTLLVLNGLALVSGAVPAYLIARRRLAPLPSLLCAALYLLNPALASLSYDVHEITFAVPLLLWALLLLQCRRDALVLLMLLVAMSFKENVGVTACFVGVYALVVQRRAHLGLALLLLGFAWVVAGIELIIPYFGGSHGNKTMMRYATLGDDWGGLLLSPVLRPAAFFGAVFSSESARYFVKVFAPFGFMPLLAPAELLLATPPLAEAILDGPGELRSGLFHYEALLVPVLYLAFVTGLVWLSARAADRTRLQTVALLLIVLAQPFWRSGGRALLEDIDGDPARAEIDAIIARVPAAAALISPQHLQPHLSDRRVSAYFRDARDLQVENTGFDYALLPAGATPPAAYAAVYRGSAYVLFQRTSPPPGGGE